MKPCVFPRAIPAWVALLVLAAVTAACAQGEGGGMQACANATSPDRSIAACSAVVESPDVPAPAQADALYNRGNAYFNKGDIQRAIDDYTQVVRLAPDYVNAYYNRGNGWSNLGDLDKAIADYAEVIRLAPGYVDAYFNRGNSYFNRGEYDLALADYTAVVERDPSYWAAFLNRGNTNARLNRHEDAIADFDAVLRLKPGETRAIAGRQTAVAVVGEPQTTEAAQRTSQPVDSGTAVAAVAPARADPAAPDEVRVALVIANGKYAAVPDLLNPPNDGDGVATVLRQAGFDVTVAHDVGRTAFLEALNRFADRAANADWAAIYFAGHGLEIDKTNFLIPVDAELRTDRDVLDEAISLDRVLLAVENARKLRLVVLDACRNNPFLADMRVTVASRSLSRGLALVEPGVGTLVAYAAKAGSVALDGQNTANSPFAAALINRLNTPGLEIGKLFRLVRDDVLAATGQQQEPFTYGSLPGEDFFFRPG